MYGVSDLKPEIEVSETTLECPCHGCLVSVARARRGEPLRQEKFRCPAHRIFISPSTFEYEEESENLLWHDEADSGLLTAIKRVKRESRLARDNSEDALTWNVFRHLERSRTLGRCLETLLSAPVADPQIVYWSYDQRTNATDLDLERARTEFGEAPARGSEPDVIVSTPERLIWIEAKLGATNETVPSDPIGTKQYLSGGAAWFRRVFQSHYAAVAIEAKRYELMRLWLLGTWVAASTNRHFILINLVRERAKEDAFRPHIADLPDARLATLSWEEVYRNIAQLSAPESAALLAYAHNKSLGYARGRLMPAFNL